MKELSLSGLRHQLGQHYPGYVLVHVSHRPPGDASRLRMWNTAAYVSSDEPSW